MPAAAAPAAISAASGLASTGVGLYQSIQEGKRRKQMEDYLANYQRQELANPMEGLQVSLKNISYLLECKYGNN